MLFACHAHTRTRFERSKQAPLYTLRHTFFNFTLFFSVLPSDVYLTRLSRSHSFLLYDTLNLNVSALDLMSFGSAQKYYF